jgi:hypothetical protein
MMGSRLPAIPVPPPFRQAATPAAVDPRVNAFEEASRKQIFFESRKKSAGLACFLNCVLPGIGYMYAGRWIIGFFVFCLWAFLILLGFVTFGLAWIVSGVLWFIGLIDGFLSVNRANRQLADKLLSAR